MTAHFTPIPTDAARVWQAGGPDAYDMVPERQISDGDGVPCRHCLQIVAAGKPYLVLAYRPFPALQPYAETGPIFLCADPCNAPEPGEALPAILTSPSYILRGYDAGHRIVYGTGTVVPTNALPGAAIALLDRPGIAYAHIRSASNNCFQVAVVKG